MISLDGPKELHDANRVFPNGEGSFDKLMNNLLYVKKRSPDFFKRVSFNTVVAPGNDYSCISDFFEANDIIEDSASLSSATLSAFNRDEAVKYDEKYYIHYRIQRTKALLASLGYIASTEVSRFFLLIVPRLIRTYNELGKIRGLPINAHPGGPCIPGARRPMVDIDGNIYPCESVSEHTKTMQIGNIFTGFDVDKIRAILNIGQITQDECKSCWNFIHCKMCAAFADDSQKLSGEKRLSRCEEMSNETLSNFVTICLLKENGFVFEEDRYNGL